MNQQPQIPPELLAQLLPLLQPQQPQPEPPQHNIIRPSELKIKTKTIKAVQTNTIFDFLCLTEDHQNSLGGIPDGSTVTLSGPPGSGKTRTSFQSLLKLASNGIKSLLVLSEETYQTANGRDDVHSRLIKMSKKLNLDFKKLSKNLIVIENLFHQNHRWEDFVKLYEETIKEEEIKFVLIDSLTSLDPFNRAIAQSFNWIKTFNHVHGITAIVVSQIKEDKDIQGGFGILHLSDVAFHIEDIYLANKDAVAEWNATSKHIRVIRAIKSSTTPIFSHPIKIEIHKDAGVIVMDKSQPKGKFPLLPFQGESIVPDIEFDF